MYKILSATPAAAEAHPTTGSNSSSPVLALLDGDAYPFHRAPPRMLRASLYHYDFTRLPSPWAARTPDAPVLRSNCSDGQWAWEALTGWRGGAVSADSKRLKPRPCAEWWRRKRVREYVPPVTRRVLLEQVVRPQGWPEQPGSEAEAAALCREGRAEKRMPRQVCEVLVTVRLLAAPLRSYVGAHVASAFVDGPLVVIVGLMTLPVVLCSAMRAML